MTISVGVTSGITNSIAAGISQSSGLTPLSFFGANLPIWLTPHEASARTIDTTASRNSIASLVNRGTNGGTVGQATKANQPTLTTGAVNGFDVQNHDNSSRYVFGTQNVSGDIYAAIVLNIINYNVSFGRIFSFTSGTALDSNADGRIVALYRNSTASELRTWQNNVALGSGGYAFATGVYRLIECLYNDTGNVITHWVNGVQAYTTAWSGFINSDTILMGADSTTFANSIEYRWPEMFVANVVPSATQVTATRNYFNQKYNLGF